MNEPAINMINPKIERRIVGRVFPDVGISWAFKLSVGIGVGCIYVVGIAVGVRVPDGVASPNTCDPLLRIVNMCVIAIGLRFASIVVIVTLCLPEESGLVGV